MRAAVELAIIMVLLRPILICQAMHVIAQSEETLGVPQSGLFYLPRGQAAGPGEARPATWALPGAGGPVNWSLQARAPPVQAAWLLAGMRLPQTSGLRKCDKHVSKHHIVCM